MKHKSLFEDVLAEQWMLLPEVIRRHYSLSASSVQSSVVTGRLEVNFPYWITPLIKAIHLAGGLIDRCGRQLNTKVEKWIEQGDDSLFWRRSLVYPDGKQVRFLSTMVKSGQNEIIEYVNFGFGLRLKVWVEDERLIYQSHGHLWSLGAITINIPDYLLLGTATIIEQALNEQSFQLDFQIKHPLWGVSYSYRGVFNYFE